MCVCVCSREELFVRIINLNILYHAFYNKVFYVCRIHNNFNGKFFEINYNNLYGVDTSRRSKNKIINMLKMKYADDIGIYKWETQQS